MYKISINQEQEVTVTHENGAQFVNGLPADLDLVANNDGSYHVLHKGVSYTIRVLADEGNALKLEVNNHLVEANIRNDLDELLKQLGMDKKTGALMNELKAPMPGMVLKLLVQEGDKVSAGDGLLVLEAMKMENNIKASGEGEVKSIHTRAGDKVEKNQVLIVFK